MAYYQLGGSQATEYFSQAFQLAEQIGDKYHQGAWLGNLGNIYALMETMREQLNIMSAI